MGKKNQKRVSEETFLLETALGEIHAVNIGIGSIEIAESKLRGVLDLNPNLSERVEALNLLAQLCAQTERPQEALEHFAKALAADSGIAVLLTEALADIFEKIEEWTWGIEVYNQGLSVHEDASFHNGLGYCLAKSGRLKEAEHHSRRAMELAPDSAIYANDLGYTLLEQGQVQEARALFERALQLDPSYELARENLRICCEAASESN